MGCCSITRYEIHIKLQFSLPDATAIPDTDGNFVIGATALMEQCLWLIII